MKNYVVWLDSKNAHVFAMNVSGTEKSTVEKKESEHHNRHKNDEHTDSHAEHYYRDLAVMLKGADQILLLGPGLAKNHFKDHLTTHDANILGKKIIGMENFESFEHRTEKQMMAKAHQFFKDYDLFHNPV